MPDIRTYHDSLLKLVPVEAVAAYTTIGGIAQSTITNRGTILYIAFFGLAVLLPFYLRLTLAVRNWRLIAVTTVSFLIWAINIDPPFAGLALYNPVYAAVVLVLWSFAIPMFGSGTGLGGDDAT